MHVTILTIGSRGDVQPYLALADELVRRGHRVRFATLTRHRWLNEPFDVERVDLQEEPLKLLEAAARDGLGGIRRGWSDFRASTMRAFEEWRDAVPRGTDLLVAHPLITVAPLVARSAGVPVVIATPLPALAPTRAFPMSYLLPRDVGPLGNRASYEVLPILLAPTRRWAKRVFGHRVPRDFHLRHPDGRPIDILHGYSERVLPTPREWPDRWRTTGFWRVPPGGPQPIPERVEAFLAAGDAPVFVGFGSMKWTRDRAAFTDRLVRPLLDGGARVLAVGGAVLEETATTRDPGVLLLEGVHSLPHADLFPRMRAVIHHAGAGTFGSVLHAGVPQWALPFFADQPLWANRIEPLGLGPAAVAPGDLTDGGAQEAIHRLLDMSKPGSRARARAGELAQAIAREDGPGRAVDRMEEVVAEGRR